VHGKQNAFAVVIHDAMTQFEVTGATTAAPAAAAAPGASAPPAAPGSAATPPPAAPAPAP
jgi:hypothetical protein